MRPRESPANGSVRKGPGSRDGSLVARDHLVGLDDEAERIRGAPVQCSTARIAGNVEGLDLHHRKVLGVIAQSPGGVVLTSGGYQPALINSGCVHDAVPT